jgi:hypothetical protein
MPLQIRPKYETNPAKQNSMTNPITHGMSMKPSMKVTDPHSIIAKETPKRRDAIAPGVTGHSRTGSCTRDGT